ERRLGLVPAGHGRLGGLLRHGCLRWGSRGERRSSSTPDTPAVYPTPRRPATASRQRVSLAGPPTAGLNSRLRRAEKRSEHGAEQSSTARRQRVSIAGPPHSGTQQPTTWRPEDRSGRGAEQSDSAPPVSGAAGRVSPRPWRRAASP